MLGDKSNSFELSIVLRRKEETIIEPHLFDQSEFNASNQIAAEILKTGMEFKLSWFFDIMHRFSNHRNIQLQ